MTRSQIIKILKAHHWKEEESKLSLHILDYWKTVHLQSRYVYRRELFTNSTYAVFQGYGFEWVRVDETRAVLDWVFKKYKRDKDYFLKKDKEFEELSQTIKLLSDNVLKKGLNDFSNKKLIDLLNKANSLGKRMYGCSLITEGADALTDEDYQRLLSKVSKKDRPEVVRVLSTAEEAGFIEKERLGLLKLAFEGKQNSGILKSSSFFKKVKNHSRRYFWCHNSFYEAVFLDEAYFLKEIKRWLKESSVKGIQKKIKELENRRKETKAERQSLYKKYKLTENAKLFFELVRYFLILQDRRKENVQRLIFCVDAVLKQAAKRFGIGKETLNNYYFISEVLDLFANGKKVRQIEFKRRKKAVSFSYIENNKIKTDWLLGKEADEVIEFFKQKKRHLKGSNVLCGFVASVGKGSKVIQGKVRIVIDPAKDIFHEGEILVTGMTRPEFVPLMRKARAIITNEGGITTHAAIVSRELGVPCIIGTKIATDILKSGDNVQLDLKDGTVKVLKGQ